MKTIAVVSIVLLSFMNMQAQDQIKQGVYTLSGLLNYNSSSFKSNGFDINVSEVMLSPIGSYFIVDYVELSFGVEYSRVSETSNGSSAMKYTNPGLELGARYYIPCGKIAPFIGASGQVSWFSMNGQTYSSPSTYFIFIGGLEVFISETAAIEPSIGYNINHAMDQSGNQFRIGIGVKYFIL